MIAVSGASGLVGSHVVLRLLSAGHAVRAQYRNPGHLDEVKRVFGYYGREGDFDRVEWFQADLLDPTAAEALLEGTQGLVHCAALVSFHARDRALLLNTNPVQTRNVVNAALEIPDFHLVHLSSVAALGRSEHGEAGVVLDEKAEWKDDVANSTYGLSKFLAENEVWRGMEEGLRACILNPGIVIGPGFWDRGGSSGLMGLVHRGFPYYSPGATGFVDVNDLAEAIALVLEQGEHGRRFVMVNEHWPYKQLMDTMARHLGVAPPRKQAQVWQVHLVRLAQALRERLGGPKASITRETAASAFRTTQYSARLFSETFRFTFRPLEACIEEYAGYFLKK